MEPKKIDQKTLVEVFKIFQDEANAYDGRNQSPRIAIGIEPLDEEE